MSGKEYELVSIWLFRLPDRVICSYRHSTPSNNSQISMPNRQNMTGRSRKIERDHPKYTMKMICPAKMNFLDRESNQTILSINKTKT